MNIPDSRNSLKNAEMPSGKRFLRLGYSNLGPLKSVFEGLTPEHLESHRAALLAGCAAKFQCSNEPSAISLTPKLRGCSNIIDPKTKAPTTPIQINLVPKPQKPLSFSMAMAMFPQAFAAINIKRPKTGMSYGSIVVLPTPTSPTIPLHICLGPTLTDPVELACAEAVAKHLSSECGRTVSVAELEGLMLYLWSEGDADGKELYEYLGPQSRPLQGLLLQARNLEGQPEPLARAELLPFVGKRFKILAREGQRGSAEVAK